MLGIYLLGISFILITARGLMFNHGTERDKKGLLILTFLLLVLLMGCRNAQQYYGSDLNNYYRTFERAINSSLSEYLKGSSMELGYLLLNWLWARVIKWPQFIIFFQAAFCCGITLRYIYKYSTDILLSILGFLSLGLFQFYLTGFRQSIAISICLIAFEMAERKNIFRFLICVFVAMTIHQTAIVFLLAYFLINLKVNKFSVFLDLICIWVVSRFVPRLIELGNKIFDKEYEGTFVGNSTGGFINVFIGGFIIFVMLYQIRKIGSKVAIEKDDMATLTENNYYQNHKMFHVLMLGTGIYFMRYQALVLERVSYYFTPTIFVLLPEVIRKGFISTNRRFLKILFIIGMLFLIYWRLKGSDYIFFWNQQI